MSLDVVAAGEPATPVAGATFFYDLADPDCYLTAERLRAELPVVCDWVAVHGPSLGLAPAPAPDSATLADRVAAQDLLPLRLPARWPPDSALATRVATYARGAGKSIAFTLAAFRQAFAGGRDLADETTVLLAAAACEMHPTAVLKGAGLRTTANALERDHERARAAGVTELPAIELVGASVHCGPHALERCLTEYRSRAR